MHGDERRRERGAIRSPDRRSRRRALPRGLYLVATPIGNLRDITLRALEILAAADLVACEDTRVTRKLFDHYGLSAPLIAYHDHNAETRAAENPAKSSPPAARSRWYPMPARR